MPAGGAKKEKFRLPIASAASQLQERFTCGVLVVDASERIVALTPEAAAHFHTKLEHWRNAPLASLPAPLPELVRDASRRGQPTSNVEISEKTPRNGKTTLRATILPIEMGGQAQVIVVFSDLSPIPILEQNIRRLDRLASLGTLSASMAHEIKNGMVAIKTFIDLLLQKGQDTELADVVNRELNRINAIVTQMLRFGSPKEAVFATVRVHELLDHLLRLLHHQISGKLISLQRRYQAETDAVRGDEVQLQQLFMNLLLNAIEAMDTKGTLIVATEITESESEGRVIRISIQDTGEGIAQENMTRIFEPFFTTKKNGTGLGLAICQRIALDHRGRIEAQSQANRGSTFSFTLPLPSS